jgi:ATP sulfurylase
MSSGAFDVSPHGGRLIDRILRGDALAEARARVWSLTQLSLNARMMSDVELLAVGAYSPLEGFMGRDDYRSVLREMRLANGLPWTLPITLAVRKAAADQLRDATRDPASRGALSLRRPGGSAARVRHR